MERTRVRVLALAVSVVCVVAVTSAVAQPTLPHEDHFKVYHTSPISIMKPLVLTDQFGSFSVNQLTLERFANPTEKIHPDGTSYPILDPFRHHTWWHIFSPQPDRQVVAIDQFGGHPWVVGDAFYLLAPALKNVPPGTGNPPIANHYVCYEAILAPDPNLPVTLVDQFGTCQVVVRRGKYLCNPVEKIADGVIYPIVDMAAHLTCYIVQNSAPFQAGITATDQFGYWQFQVFQNDCLCVPAFKDHPVRTEETTWGKVKALYR